MSRIFLQPIKKSTKIVLLWYVITSTLILINIIISGRLNRDVYFHPIISIIILILLICNLFVIPLFLVIKYILKDDETRVEKIMNIFLASFCIFIIAIFLLFNILPHNKKIFDTGTVNMKFIEDRIFVQEAIWLETYNHVYVYKVENLFFVIRQFDEDYIVK